MPRRVCFVVALIVWAITTPLSAQQPAPAPSPAPQPQPAPQPTPPTEEDKKLEEAKRLFRVGNELRQAGDYERALEYYIRSRKQVPSIANMVNAAICLDKLKRYDEALELYEELIDKFRDKMTEDDRKALAPDLARLRSKIGSIDVEANVEGVLVIDSRRRGTLPRLTPVRVLPGKRRVRVIKDGYRTFEKTVTVKAGETLRVNARLEPLADAGRARVADAALAGAQVIVDGAPVGTAPWDGALAPGKHWFALLKDDKGSAPKEIVIVKGQTALLLATLLPLGPEMDIHVVPTTAELTIGEVRIGGGRWRGRLPIGQHQLIAKEEGYFDKTQSLDVTPDAPGHVELKLVVDEQHARWGVTESGRLWFDVMGAFGAAPSFGSATEDSCATWDCSDDGAALGFAVGARGGYEFPFRLSLELAGGFLSAAKSLSRGLDHSFSAQNMTIPTRIELTDDLQVSGAFAVGGLGYRLPFADVMELRAHLLVGALFSFSQDSVAGTISAGGKTVDVHVVDQGDSVGAANLVVLPSLELGLRFGGFGVGLSMSAAFVTLEGPEQKNGALSPAGDFSICQGPDAQPLEVDCAGADNLVTAETAYGPFVLLLPGVTVGYLFE